MILLSVNGAILAYNMTMEDEMAKEETYDTHVYVEGPAQRPQGRPGGLGGGPLPVGMYTDEHSEICSIRFGNSFTLNVVTPHDLIDLAQEIEDFGRRAVELHYNKDRETWLEAARIQEKLEDAGVIEPVTGDTEKPPVLLPGRTQMTQSTGNRPSSLKTAYARAYAHGDVQDILRTRTHARGTAYRMEQ